MKIIKIIKLQFYGEFENAKILHEMQIDQQVLIIVLEFD